MRILAPGLLMALLATCSEPLDSGTTSRPDDGELPQARLEGLRSVGYVDFDPDREAQGDRSGVTVFERGKAWEGYNLYCSRTSPEAFLIDMQGDPVHGWTYPTAKGAIWDFAILLDGGDLVVVVNFEALLRLDWDSKLVWSRELVVHHDVAQAADGGFHTITSESRQHRGLEVRFPAFLKLSSSGETLERWSTYEHLREIQQSLEPEFFLDTILDEIEADASETRPGLDRKSKLYNYFHANTVTSLGASELGRVDPRFRSGNLLICLRNVNQILVLDQDDKRILWSWGAGELQRPHHPTFLENGRILIFDNGVERGYSRVLELEPVTGKVEWQYVADPPMSFYTRQKGSAQRLPNGNTLICEGDPGRAFEVTRAGEIVWEWLNPLVRAGRRASLYRMWRLSPDVVEPLLR